VRLIWTDKAIYDLEAVRAYISSDKPGAARKTVLRILKLANDLLQHPVMGRAGSLPGTRELIVSDTPYIIPYRVRESCAFCIHQGNGPKNFSPLPAMQADIIARQ